MSLNLYIGARTSYVPKQSTSNFVMATSLKMNSNPKPMAGRRKITANTLYSNEIIIIIISYTKDNNPRLNTNATSHPYGRTTKETIVNPNRGNDLAILYG